MTTKGNYPKQGNPAEIQVAKLSNFELAAKLEQLHKLKGDERAAVLEAAVLRLRWDDIYWSHRSSKLETDSA